MPRLRQLRLKWPSFKRFEAMGNQVSAAPDSPGSIPRPLVVPLQDSSDESDAEASLRDQTDEAWLRKQQAGLLDSLGFFRGRSLNRASMESSRHRKRRRRPRIQRSLPLLARNYRSCRRTPGRFPALEPRFFCGCDTYLTFSDRGRCRYSSESNAKDASRIAGAIPAA